MILELSVYLVDSDCWLKKMAVALSRITGPTEQGSLVASLLARTLPETQLAFTTFLPPRP